jgi:acyl-CoA thioester hydrolase
VGYPLVAPNGAQFVVRRAEVDWLRPARLDDLMLCTTRVVDVRAASVTMRQSFSVGMQVCAVVKITLAHVSDVFRPTRLPAEVANLLASITDT